MRPVVVLALLLFAVFCLFAGSASMMGATAGGNRVEAAAADTSSALTTQPDQPEDDLRVQINVVRHASSPEWVLALLLAFVVVGLWVLLTAFDLRIRETH